MTLTTWLSPTWRWVTVEVTTVAFYQIVPRRSTRIGVKDLSSLSKVRLYYNRKTILRFKSYYYLLSEKKYEKSQFQHCIWPICDIKTAFFDDLSILQKKTDRVPKSEVFFCSGHSQSVWLYMYQLYSRHVWINLITSEDRHFKNWSKELKGSAMLHTTMSDKRFIIHFLSFPETKL